MSDQPPLPPPDECPFCEAARRQAKAWGYESRGCLGHYPMSDLYRLDGFALRVLRDNDSMHHAVSVEPDYEAAWGAFVENENHEPTECACQCEHTTERAVQAAVDAAYGGRR